MDFPGFRRLAGVLAAAAFVAGCGSGRAVSVRLTDNDPAVRVRAVQEVVRQDRREMIPLLLARLEDEDPAVRLFANAGLEEMTGRRSGFQAHAPLAERRAAVSEWRRYLETGGTPEGDAAAGEETREPRDAFSGSGASKP